MPNAVLKFANEVTAKDGTITAILSTEAVDRDGDIVMLSGWQMENVKGPLPLMSCHKYDSLLSQIGQWNNLHPDPARKALVGNPEYYTDAGNPEADYGYQLALKGRATYSVGFMPIAWEPRKGASGLIYTSQEPLEGSHVPIPSNREAVQLMVKAFQQRWMDDLLQVADEVPDPIVRAHQRLERKWADIASAKDYATLSSAEQAELARDLKRAGVL